MLFIPGNPGIARYYEQFLVQVSSLLDVPPIVYCCSYPGHTPSTHKHLATPLSLKEQIQHKLDILDYVRHRHPGKQLVLAGHSLGAFMVVEILKHKSLDTLCKVIVLFPTLHSIGNTPNGTVMKRICHPTTRFAIASIATVLNATLPRSWIEWIVSKATNHSGNKLAATTDLIVHQTGRHALALAYDEMHLMDEMDQRAVKVLTEHAPKIAMYYGTTDGWCPLWHYHELKMRVPECTEANLVNIHLCNERIAHAFVEDDAATNTIAKFTAEWISR